MLQTIEFDDLIPSCEIYEVKYNRETGKWTYVYAFETPFELTDDNEEELIVYGHISNMDVRKADLNELSINIHFKTLSDYIHILNTQRQADRDYRIDWLKRHPKCPINTVILENRDYDHKELQERVTYASTILMKTDNITVFAAVK